MQSFRAVTVLVACLISASLFSCASIMSDGRVEAHRADPVFTAEIWPARDKAFSIAIHKDVPNGPRVVITSATILSDGGLMIGNTWRDREAGSTEMINLGTVQIHTSVPWDEIGSHEEVRVVVMDES